MISRQTLVSQLEGGTNFQEISLPSGKFTQPDTMTMIQIEKERLDTFRNKLSHNTSLAHVAGQLPEEVVQSWLKPRYNRASVANNSVHTSARDTISTATNIGYGSSSSNSGDMKHMDDAGDRNDMRNMRDMHNMRDTGERFNNRGTTVNYYSNTPMPSGQQPISAAAMLAGLTSGNLTTSFNSVNSMSHGNDKGNGNRSGGKISIGHVNANQGATDSAYGCYLNFKENENIPIPDMLLSLFSENIQQQRGMLYGMRNPDSFYKCLLLLQNAEYIMNTKYKRDQDVMTLKTTISNAAKSLFEKLDYVANLSKSPASAQSLADAITKENHTDPGVFQFCADYLSKPLYIVSMDEKKIWHYKCLNPNLNNQGGYFIVDYQGCYLPFYHADTAHLVHLPLTTIKKAGFRECNTDQPDTSYGFYVKKPVIQADAHHNTDKSSKSTDITTTLPSKSSELSESLESPDMIALDSLAREKLADLQVKAKQLGIDIRKTNKKGKKVNKLKAELWDELNVALKNMNNA